MGAIKGQLASNANAYIDSQHDMLATVILEGTHSRNRWSRDSSSDAAASLRALRSKLSKTLNPEPSSLNPKNPKPP